jgi:SAM-dependent methyltransferase
MLNESTNINQLINSFTLFKFIKDITPPYNKTKLFMDGIIDESGEILIDTKINPYDQLILNIKKLLAQIPNPNTKAKLKHHVLAYFVNDGKSLTNIRTNSQDLVFSYDSFVHIHKNVIDDYLKEIHRVLKPGGKSYIHHSWLYLGNDYSFKNIAGRADMNPDLFKSLVEKNNMKVVEQKTIKFEPLSNWDGTDSITIFEK